MSIENSNDLIGNRTRDLPARSIMPQHNCYFIFVKNLSFKYRSLSTLSLSDTITKLSPSVAIFLIVDLQIRVFHHDPDIRHYS
jgi:hypothetical protein